ncbi:MAG: hypothetical protein Q4F72_12690, partial [Desulfovibrionaceae bacterium]|nr:hypothetical protein [Desulfovibrionaceae bacterium]
WTRENGRFKPHPATYLGREKWTDEPPARTARPQASYVSPAAAREAALAAGRKRIQELLRRKGVAEALGMARESAEGAVDTTAREAARDGGADAAGTTAREGAHGGGEAAATALQGGGHDC